MYDLTALQLLLVVNTYLLLALVVFGLSVKALACQLQGGHQCGRQHRKLKSLVALPLVLSCLALLAIGLFAVGMAHGSRPQGYQVILFVLGCLLPVVLLIIWLVGSLWLDGLWVVLIAALFAYLLLINPALYVQYWADSNAPGAQLWMARHAAQGEGGLELSESTARRWYSRAAQNGSAEAQYHMAATARRQSEALKWYRLAAEQNNLPAMVQLARRGQGDDERLVWLQRAVARNHPEALYMQARKTMSSDLPEARRWLLQAAEQGSRQAMLSLVAEFRRGGVLFAQSDVTAEQWQTRLKETQPDAAEPAHFTQAFIEQALFEAQRMAEKVREGDPLTLYTLGREWLQHPAKDADLHTRAVAHLSRAADQHADAALELARLAIASSASAAINAEALRWYQLAASNNNLSALKTLIRYYIDQPDADAAMLRQSLHYNQRLLELLQPATDSSARLTRQHWAFQYRDTQQRLARLNRLGGSWRQARAQAAENPQHEYLLATELLKDRQFALGMQHLRSAARRNDSDARYALAVRTLRGPRSFSEEVQAISELQALDKLGFLPASLRLGSLYQSGSGVVPRNFYLSRQLLRKVAADTSLSQRADRWLARVPDFINSLALQPGRDVSSQLDDWYQRARTQVQDTELLRQQYLNLLDHFRDADGMRRQLEGPEVESAANSFYQLAQTLQSHDLGEATQWLRRAARSGDNDARYDLAVRMLRGKKNTPEQQQELVHWANTAARSGHVGALVFLANRHRDGYGGFEQNSDLARDYYRQALAGQHSTIVFAGRVAGRDIRIERVSIENALRALNE